LTPDRLLATPSALEMIERKLTVPGLGSRAGETARTEPPLWRHLSAVQQTAYIAMESLAMGFQMGVNVRPFVRCSVAPARS
jgi:hypothetical protein